MTSVKHVYDEPEQINPYLPPPSGQNVQQYDTDNNLSEVDDQLEQLSEEAEETKPSRQRPHHKRKVTAETNKKRRKKKQAAKKLNIQDAVHVPDSVSAKPNSKNPGANISLSSKSHQKSHDVALARSLCRRSA